MKRCKIIGLTGQSGAGKSTVALLFAQNGFQVIDADALVASIYDSGSVCLKAVAAEFGADILYSDGSLNRRLLAQRAFCTAEKTALLGAIVHPFVTAEFLKILKQAKGAVVLDAPQLFESNLDTICDTIISVVSDEQTRLRRICARDNISVQQARERMGAQLSEQFFRESSDFVIENNGDAERLKAQIQQLISVLKAEVM